MPPAFLFLLRCAIDEEAEDDTHSALHGHVSRSVVNFGIIPHPWIGLRWLEWFWFVA